MLPDGTYDPQDPQAVAQWMQQVDERLTHLHECIETRDRERKDDVNRYHEENRESGDLQMAALEEIKQEVKASAMWISDEEQKRRRDAFKEEGRQEERDRWLRTARRLREWSAALCKYGGLIAGSSALTYIVSKFG